MDEEFVNLNEMYENGDGTTSNQPDTNIAESQDSLHRVVGYLVASIAIVCCYFIFGFGKSDSPNPQTTSIEETPPVIPSTSAERKNSSSVEIVSDKVKELTGLAIPDQFDWKKEEEVSANRAVVSDFKKKLGQISELGSANSDDLERLKSLTDELRTSEAGAKIGSDEELVSQYIALQEKVSELSDRDSVAKEFSQDMQSLLERVEAANDTSYSPQTFVVERAEMFISKLNAKSAEIKKLATAFDGLVETAEQNEAGATLETAIRRQQTAAGKELAQLLAKAKDDATAEANLSKALAEKKRIKAKADLQIAKTNAQTDELVVEEDLIVAKAAEEKLEREFNRDLNAIRTKLVPFLSEGRTLRGNAKGKGPVSFSLIDGKGALENTADGLSLLSKLASNGRPYGDFPVNIAAYKIENPNLKMGHYSTTSYKAISAYLEEAQALLNKYGRLMADKGMLAE